ncbi:MAG: 2OG-Fe(II) oxygenase [Alphaproteobacteria bacterium]|mgnify:CR=1 FL=1|jgi:hypothetical protein|nr:2OG-Fe(II) oxygenase [Alphaproteobacteria bacterium]MDP6563624.1 2OG-Fe(II) oxygenase [Alphaproteobacteria bacterium]MDP6814595.1 2OG-Fe(II) oxygenase [Alphaproteobacteria bacterium]
MSNSLQRRLAALDWPAIADDLAEIGHARTGAFLSPGECGELAALYDDDRRFRSTIDMARYRFGAGQYRYFDRPLPRLIHGLRGQLYRRLAPLANRMMRDLGKAERYPASLSAYLAHCRSRGQGKPTPLLLRYRAGGYNRLHRDLYGDEVFPLQAVCLLSRPGIDFTGGEFLLVEQQPRAQSIGHAISPVQGELLIFPVAERPVAGSRGHFRAAMRHGVSRILTGERLTLGLIFHDAA